MTVAKLFKNGRSQAVRLPKAFRFDGEEVEIRRWGNGVLLLPRRRAPWAETRAVAEEAGSYPAVDPPVEQERDMQW